MPCMILSGSNNDIVSPPPISGGGVFCFLPSKLYFSKKNTNKIGRMEEQGLAR